MFGKDLIEHYRQKYPMGWVDLMVAFESRKRSANPSKPSPLNISIPFSFIDYYKKHKVRHLYEKDSCKAVANLLKLDPRAWADRSFKDLILLRLKQLSFVRANVLISYFSFDNDGLITKASHCATMFCGQKAKLIVSLKSNFYMELNIIINVTKRFTLIFLIQIVRYHRPRCQEIWRQGSPMDATGHAPFLTGSDATFVHFYDRENYTGHWRCAQQQRDKRYK